MTATAEEHARRSRKAEQQRRSAMPNVVRCGFPMTDDGPCQALVSPRYGEGATRCGLHRGKRPS